MKKIIGVIVAIIILIAVCVGGFFIWKNNHKNNDNNLSVEEQIKKEFSKNLEMYGQEYRIDKIEILDEEYTKHIIEWDNGGYYREGDVLAIVTYAIKDDVRAGNGRLDGEWTVDMRSCIAFRDGKIVSDGTGW